MLQASPALKYFMMIGLLISIQASAEDAICRNATGAIHKLSDKDNLHSDMMGVRATYQIRAMDGFLYGSESGVIFNGNNADENKPHEAIPKTVGWGDGDILVVRAPESKEQKARGEKNPVKFFAQYDEAPYNGPKDKGTKGGIYKVEQADLVITEGLDGVMCSTQPLAYNHHFFPRVDSNGKDQGPKVGDVFCVLDRKGTSYSLIKVTNVCDSGLVFEHKFNGKNNFFATEYSNQKNRLANEEIRSRQNHVLP